MECLYHQLGVWCFACCGNKKKNKKKRKKTLASCGLFCVCTESTGKIEGRQNGGEKKKGSEERRQALGFAPTRAERLTEGANAGARPGRTNRGGTRAQMKEQKLFSSLCFEYDARSAREESGAAAYFWRQRCNFGDKVMGESLHPHRQLSKANTLRPGHRAFPHTHRLKPACCEIKLTWVQRPGWSKCCQNDSRPD